jgi:hypothetical protein
MSLRSVDRRKPWAAQHHDELTGEQAALDTLMTELH